MSREPPPADPTLTDLRRRLGELDAELLTLVARRQELAASVGAIKDRTDGALRDPAQEGEVTARARAGAEALGLSPALAEQLFSLLIHHSLAVQEQQRIRGKRTGEGRTAMVIGGAGRIGAWFSRFLAAQGFAVEVADPVPLPPRLAGFAHRTDWKAGHLAHDIVVVAAPLRDAAAILEELARLRPPGIVFDLGSLKSPLRPGLEACARAGVRITSVHPMFGPSVDLLAGRHVVVVDAGNAEANAAAKALFEGTTARVVELALNDHDREMAYVLGLSHAVNIAFLDALARSGSAAANLARVSSSTFDSQAAVAARVAAENPHLYFEIQYLNTFGLEALDALHDAVERLRAAVAAGDEESFVATMQRGEAYLTARGSPP
ncbi:MAG: bifunctional chorismate mutase/prephenate dehydrogenase [Gemmatimonadaceae bacterium]|nr:bifunctional chorismate mutase/prephenate dehydrogenase [Gemmatimonadaceae bacterium]